MKVKAILKDGTEKEYKYDSHDYTYKYWDKYGWNDLMTCPTCNKIFIRRIFNQHVKTDYHKLAVKLISESIEPIEDITQTITDYKNKDKLEALKIKEEGKKIKRLVNKINSREIPSNIQQQKLMDYIDKYPDNALLKVVNCIRCI